MTYSAWLLVEGPRKIPLEWSNTWSRVKMAQVVKVRFWV
jgi:hypothetical protein